MQKLERNNGFRGLDSELLVATHKFVESGFSEVCDRPKSGVAATISNDALSSFENELLSLTYMYEVVGLVLN